MKARHANISLSHIFLALISYPIYLNKKFQSVDLLSCAGAAVYAAYATNPGYLFGIHTSKHPLKGCL